MIGGMTGVATDVIPFGFAIGPIAAYLVGLNVVGLRRRGYSRDDMHRMRARLPACCSSVPGTFAERARPREAEFAGDPVVGKIIDFIRAKRSRQLMMAGGGNGRREATTT